MAKRRNILDITPILRDWTFEPGEVHGRLVEAEDGRILLQVRIDMGLLQMESTGRPDGTRPGGYETYLDYLLHRAIAGDKEFQLDEEQCTEVDREFMQFYQRRVGWLALREFDRAVRDADHSLALMDFAHAHSPSDAWTAAHEQYRPFILFHRTQAAALGRLEAAGAEGAVEEINRGLDRIRDFFGEIENEEMFEESDLAERLKELREEIREHYAIGRTLREQLADAVAAEQYELAAELRDKLAGRKRRRQKRPLG